MKVEVEGSGRGGVSSIGDQLTRPDGVRAVVATENSG